jgi:hypothetical protein
VKNDWNPLKTCGDPETPIPEHAGKQLPAHQREQKHHQKEQAHNVDELWQRSPQRHNHDTKSLDVGDGTQRSQHSQRSNVRQIE